MREKFISLRRIINASFLLISIYCDKRRQKKNPVTDLTPEFVEQLWGEAVWLFKISKDPFLLTPKQDELLKENREQFRYTSGLEDELIDTLENKFKDQDFISNNDFYVSEGGRR